MYIRVFSMMAKRSGLSVAHRMFQTCRNPMASKACVSKSDPHERAYVLDHPLLALNLSKSLKYYFSTEQHAKLQDLRLLHLCARSPTACQARFPARTRPMIDVWLFGCFRAHNTLRAESCSLFCPLRSETGTSTGKSVGKHLEDNKAQEQMRGRCSIFCFSGLPQNALMMVIHQIR